MTTLEPVFYIDSSAVREGKLPALKAAMRELADFVKANEPQLIAYDFFLSEGGDRVTVVALHPDSASLERHFEVAGSAFRKFAELIRMERIDIYGKVSDGVMARLREKASMLGSGAVVTHRLQAGFFRLGDW